MKRNAPFSNLITIVLAALLLLGGCTKEDRISPAVTNPTEADNYLLLDYQDTLRLAYAVRTDLYNCNNIVLQLRDGGRLVLLSHNHLDPLAAADSADLVSPILFALRGEGIEALLLGSPFADSICITRGEAVCLRQGSRYDIRLLGATESGLGFRSHFSGPVHDLTAPSNQGGLYFGSQAIDFRLGVLTEEGTVRTYRLIGSNPDIQCTIRSTTDIAGQSLRIADDLAPDSGTVRLTATLPDGTAVTATSGTLKCSCYGNIYSLILSVETNLGPATGTFTGPIYAD